MSSLNKLLSLTFLVMAMLTAVSLASGRARADDIDTLRSHIEAMKEAPRGPFSRLRWFCADGTVLPPKPYACVEHGGGVQHGEYSKAALKIRQAGYPIATLLADVSPQDILARDDGESLLESMLVEQFLIGFDDGWILRRARFYRGAIQVEDEERGGQALLEALTQRNDFINDRFLLVREAVRLLPHDYAHVSLADVRGRAAAVAERDPGFRGLRGKIHGRPDQQDAARVREYARESGVPALAQDYEQLAQSIEQAYETGDLPRLLTAAQQLATTDVLRASLGAMAQQAAERNDAAGRRALATQAMALIRTNIGLQQGAKRRVQLLDTSLQLERIAFVAARSLQNGDALPPRRTLLQWLRHDADGLFGAGLITMPEYQEIILSLEQIDDEPLRLAAYRNELAQLGMAPQWAARQLQFHLGDAIAHYTAIEPLAEQYIADRLRGGPAFSYDAVHATLALDAQAASNIRHEVFGRPMASGLRSLNPGLARGTLYVANHDTTSFDAHGIYIVPETIAKLPPVAGILTRSEGNALSHVQLLARNLGIPNIVLSDAAIERIQPYVGKRTVIAASAGGVVRIAEDSFEWDNVFRAGEEAERAPLHVDLHKLQLNETRLYRLDELRATDSGRVVGPKAAKLGELMHQFPGHVSPGLAIPFGVYRTLLQQPVSATERISMQQWLGQQYRALAQIRDTDLKRYETELARTLRFVREWFDAVPLPDGFEAKLRKKMEQAFGAEGSYGVFVRSDTNVEDLPNFSGAGLNLTEPNVVGFETTMAAIRRVWASPFTERAFAWRQGLMDKPEHVYASVLLQKGVPAEKSGVLVTQDIDTGDRSVYTVVVNEGVGGGVDGQLAETLKVSMRSGSVRRISTATATERRELRATGGVELVPVTRSDALLSEAEIELLTELTRLVPKRVPEFASSRGKTPPAADIEFGFYDGKLWLFQIRPLVESTGANRHGYLNALDAGLRESARRRVDLDRAPEVK